MSTVSGVTGPSETNYSDGTAQLSPDALLAYCQMQLGGLDSEITDQMNAQQRQLDERRAVEKVQTVLESFGDNGPQNINQARQCYQAFQDAISSLGANDPVAATLQQQLDNGTATCGYDPGGPKYVPMNGDLHLIEEEPTWSGKGPDPSVWKGQIEAFNTLAGDIKSNADIQMLTLQDLVSQRQQAVQLASGMMSKEDQTLESEAKAIGQ